ncbi:MAG: histidine triad nucleotide-binding protein [bacterium]
MKLYDYQPDCLFCKIIQGQIPSTKVYEDDCAYAFRDINPQAKTHILVVPKTHIASCAALGGETEALVGRLFTAVAAIARAEGLEGGFRVVSNAGPDACQSVPHLHFHILGGEKLSDQMA